MQSYVGLFYQAFFHREFDALRSVLAQRLIITQVEFSSIYFEPCLLAGGGELGNTCF